MEQGIKKRFDLAKNRELALIFLIVGIIVIVSLRNSEFLKFNNLIDILKDTTILIMLSCGMMVVMLTGGIDISIASNLAFAGFVVPLIIRDYWQDMPPAVAILIGMGLGCMLGLLNGFLVGKLKILPFIVTMGTMNMFRGLTFVVSDNSRISAPDMSTSFKQIASGDVFGISNLVLFAAICLVAFYVFLNWFKTGKRIYAVGSNLESAKIVGINTDNIIMLAYVISGVIAGMCGVLWSSKYALATSTAADGFEMNVIPACVIGGVSFNGGTGKVQGVLLGAILMGLINNILPMLLISSYWKKAILGIIIIIAVLSNAIIVRRAHTRNLKMREI